MLMSQLCPDCIPGTPGLDMARRLPIYATYKRELQLLSRDAAELVVGVGYI